MGERSGTPEPAGSRPVGSPPVAVPPAGSRLAAAALPHRGRWGDARPAALAGLPLPPGRLPLLRGGRPLKRWRYVGVYGPELMVCVGAVQLGFARQSFWAVLERAPGRLHERTRLSRGGVRLSMDEPGRVLVQDGPVRIDLTLDESDGVETICPHGRQHAWTRKQGGVPARGRVEVEGNAYDVDAFAVVDDSAGYHARHTAWRWSAGVGRAEDGRAVAWNLVEGINDPPAGSERTLWVEGSPPVEAGSAAFAAGLTGVTTADGGDLRFAAEAVRQRRENLLLVRSSYRQPFGTFSGLLPGGLALAEGFGVMEEHTAAW
jgi:uncharacterized protein DUF2804